LLVDTKEVLKCSHRADLVVSCRQDYLDALVIIVRFTPLKAEDRVFGAFVEGNVRPGEFCIDKVAGGEEVLFGVGELSRT
jgi:hypothetical protein